MKNSQLSTFSSRLNSALRDLGISQSELARRMGITPQAVQRWCNGISSPRQGMMEKLSSVTGKPEHWFLMPLENGSESPAHQESRATSSVTDDQKTVALTDEERQLIHIYRDLPGSERKRMLELFQLRLNEINDFIERHLKK
ncbi:helix-turn-helix transcriptional regulator [Dickeya sp. ws52]|uniref:helix-turn-helix domain-containing protein n=1 Tax=Dickeya sp. ws52 TaxID=2576377 RepID=UPI00118012CE|nr:helix-turn-helix transcriptional regulator [Dickeya sp. ws52]TYL43925.1 helix-turn-helix domain-containing protein [Dickeya sp. ws52]